MDVVANRWNILSCIGLHREGNGERDDENCLHVAKSQCNTFL